MELQLNLQQDFMRDLSFHVSEIFLRSESTVAVMVTPEIQMIIGGSSEPAYHITITALHSAFGPTKNKRTAQLLHDFMSETLRIQPRRGIIQFESLSEENLATDGVTMLQAIEEMDRNRPFHKSDITCSVGTPRHCREENAALPTTLEQGRPTTPNLCSVMNAHAGTSPAREVNDTRGGTQISEKKKLKQRKSIMSIFRR